MKHIFIINPNAGKKLREELLYHIKEVFKQTDYMIEVTTKAKEAGEIAKRYARSGIEMCIYACGGDGTLNEVINGMHEYDNAYLGIIPIGTGNDFIKTLAPTYKKSDFLKIEKYLEPTVKYCDVMDINGFISLNTTSVGLDVSVAQNVEKFKHLPFSSNTIPYYMALINSLMSPLSHTYNILLDGKPVGKEVYTFVVACNGKFYGGGFCPCPQASINDGYIDVCLIKKVTRRKIIALSNAYKKGTHSKQKELVSLHRVKKIQILSEDKLVINVDGEIIERVNPEIKIVPNKLKLLLPKV